MFLKKIMLMIGFHPTWVTLIMDCVQTVKFSILLNGVPIGNITPQRGSRQGDSLSPYLFLIRSKALSTLIKGVVLRKAMSGIKPGKHCLEISHLFFANDSLIFCKASIEQIWALRSLLKTYKLASGQMGNERKSAYFSPLM